METNKQKQNLSDLAAKNEQLTLEKRDLQNQSEDLRMNMTQLENKTEDLRINMTKLENQNKDFMMNMTNLQNQNQDLKGSMTKLENQNQDLKGSMTKLENLNKDLRINMTNLQNQNQDLKGSMTKLENQTEQLTAEKKLCENQTKEMTVNMTTQQKQIEQLRNSSDKLNRMKAAIIKYTNFPVDLFCPDGVCQTCPKDWIQFNKSCYYFDNSNAPWKTWNQSRQFCHSNKSDLVVISSQEEQTFVKSTIEYYYDTWHGYWIGLRRINNNWTWVDDSQDTLGYWNNPGSSDNFTLIIKNSTENQSWYINQNSSQNRFICEIKSLIF
ncbi:asialoglycoprotein receptor 1 isoform X1 [Oryzias melastigma]|uniref:Low affinity immunoglobulin epsilon Fc receptor-like n=1 Tax=Oryzias melastigma TaxID=30732 RepID=A0A3B3DUM3_ORYME|nr:asialoglycoprotein receptor 1 isoform X1 [Oryzias melastigma]